MKLTDRTFRRTPRINTRASSMWTPLIFSGLLLLLVLWCLLELTSVSFVNIDILFTVLHLFLVILFGRLCVILKLLTSRYLPTPSSPPHTCTGLPSFTVDWKCQWRRSYVYHHKQDCVLTYLAVIILLYVLRWWKREKNERRANAKMKRPGTE